MSCIRDNSPQRVNNAKILYSGVVYYIIQWSCVLYYTVELCTILYSGVVYYIIQWSCVLYYTVELCTIWRIPGDLIELFALTGVHIY